MPETLTLLTEARESLGLSDGAGSGSFLIDIITPGWGSSGYYSAPVLEQAATDKVFPAGTHMYLDHPTATEKKDLPERSVRTLAAVLEKDAYWDASKGALVAPAKVYSHNRAALKEMKDDIGVSIRASAEVGWGEAEGRTGQLITRLVEGKSVDFVTHAGRGGRIAEVLESARATDRAIDRGVDETTANELSTLLREALREAYGADRTYVWMRDYDDAQVWFEVETPDSSDLFQQSYSLSNESQLSLTGDRIEVRQVITYVPVHPAGRTPTEESEEDTMAETQIEESVLADLREKAGRVSALEAERDTEKARADKAEGELAESTRQGRLDAIIAEADVDFDALQVAGLKSQAKVDESGELDEKSFKDLVAESAAKLKEAGGAGSVRGFGQTGPSVQEAELREANDKQRARIFGRNTKEA